jgi:hypothetical protein
MIKSADVFMPCIKAKNKISVAATESAASFVNQSHDQTLKQTI